MTASEQGSPPSDRIFLAVDPGARKTGLAYGRASGFITPIGVIEFPKLKACGARIAEEMHRLGAELCIIGLPVDANGAETGGCHRSRMLGQYLKERGYNVHYQSEFLTTHEARQRAREIGRAPSIPVDDIAASILLEDYLAEAETGKKEDE